MSFSRMLVTAACVFVFSGCIRLTGTAGYWHKDEDGEAAKGKSVTLDTNDLVNPDRTKGNIAV